MLSDKGIAALGVLLGLLVAVGLMIAIVRSGRNWRKPLVVALIAVLALTSVGGVAWAGARSWIPAPAPVDANLTLFTEGSNCSGDTVDCFDLNALYALNAVNGSVRWKVVEPKPAHFNYSSPLFHDGAVYAYTFNPADPTPSPYSYVLTAWRVRDGARLWSTRVPGPCCETPMTFMAGDYLAILVFPTTTSWGLLLLRAGDGAVVGVTQLPEQRVPAVANNNVYQCTPEGAIVATRLSDGAPLWRAPASGAPAQSFAECSVMQVGGAVFASLLNESDSPAVAPTGQLLALNATNGQELWRYATPEPVPLATGDDLVVLGEGKPYLIPSGIVALRASDGTVAWRRTGFQPEPAVADHIPYLNVTIGAGLALVGGGSSSTLWALRTDDGSTVWRTGDDNHVFDTVGIVDGTIFVRSRFFTYGILHSPQEFADSSYFTALRASNGAPYWQTPLDTSGGSLVMGDV